ncbi:AAEL012690-PA [Aedes aegypti]|uniref:Exonuclease 3'-5' domain-containing protein 2 n=2 Tax=Aedes aegypti TaxID=7159 RepID=A0A1S4FWU6_AEDAE|nr:exonuclease 3'-5' domain-containing protein 2 [Aedes aegypti]EAT35135.1 AAEL012690-PA [Aedes aegypti]
MTFTDREKTIATTAIVAAVGAGALFLFSNRRKLVRRFTDPLYNQSVRIVTNPEDCQKVIGLLRDHCREFRVLGFDCEWVNEQGKRHPVALLQLATHRGLCALIRLCEMKRIPPELGELLNDPAIVKVGVGPLEDAKLLRHDYNLKVESTLDLRHLADRCGVPGPYGMAKLAEKTLGVKLDKHWRIRASNWENAQLTERQIQYAASDAHVAVELFRTFAKKAVPRSLFSSQKSWLTKTINELECFFDQRFHDRFTSSSDPNRGKKKLLSVSKRATIETKRAMATRAKPLYDNCLMQAPDGELLCTCDRKKAEWYVIKELAEIVTDQPTYTIRLKFEPKGRAVGDVGKYYQMAKENKCVVCGAKDSYIRKNVVPRDYRRHFPLVMKEHISHDVLLLCAPCHRTSNMHDENMRLSLSSRCSAPFSTQDNPKQICVEDMSDLRKAARALVYCAGKIPEERQKAIRKKIQKLLSPGTELTAELLEHYANINVAIPNENYCAHGEKVVDHFKQTPGGLSELEKMWREHFLQTMKPKYLPDLWSVEHNYKRLEIRADEGRVNDEDLIIAGVPLPSHRNSSAENTSSESTSSKTKSNGYSGETYSYSYSYSQEFSISSVSNNGNDSTTRDAPSYRDEEVVDTEKTAFYSDREESETMFGSIDGSSAASSTTVGKTFQTVQTATLTNGNENDQPSTSTSNGEDNDEDESELTTGQEFASIETHSYDSDDSDSTLSQPSMTLLNSTDDWDAEANEPSVNGSVLLGAPPSDVRPGKFDQRRM